MTIRRIVIPLYLFAAGAIHESMVRGLWRGT
jgi:hypothetical protein